MSDHIDRQNWITLLWLEWRRKLGHTPTIAEQMIYCRRLAWTWDSRHPR